MRASLLFLIFIVLGEICYADEDFEHRCFKNEHGVCEYVVSIYQLISNPSFFHNKRVVFMGHLYKETDPYNLLVIFPTKGEAALAIPSFLDGIAINVDEKGFEKIRIDRRLFSGVFRVSEEPYPYYLGFLDID
jgi:hypothetical protein